MQEELKRQRTERILAFMEDEDYRPMKKNEMASLLCVPRRESKDFNAIIEHLLSKKKIRMDEGKRLCLEKHLILTGEFMSTRRGFGFVRTGDEEDVFIPEEECKNAFHGDIVQVHLTNCASGGKWRRRGVITRIVERKNHTVVGTFSRNRNITFVIPDNEKLGRDIYIPKGATLDAVDGHKVVVEITDYGSEKKSPEGQVIQILGHLHDPGVDVLSIIKDFGLPEQFPEAVMEQVLTIPESLEAPEYEGRRDLREWDTVTIDGEDAKDLDDAITIQKTGEGNYELGVHIADVAHYVTEQSPLDKEALERGTSVYLADRVIPMIPHKLSNGICSLNAGEDRLALSCLMTFDGKGRLMEHEIVETVIHVTERMNYSDVNDILTHHTPETCRRYEALLPMFETMAELAAILRKNRKKQGSIDFDFAECKIQLDDEGHPVNIVPYERNTATRLIEEFMLAANKVVAEEYFWLELPFLYRTHEYPDLEKIRDLARTTAAFGYHLRVGNEEVHPGEIQKLITQIEGTEEEDFLSRLTLRSMKRAKYSTTNEGHFGLAASYYCHFTSPIRRYPDLQIHRIIKENLHQGLHGKRYEHYEALLPEVAQITSERERRADDAEREVDKLKKAEYMQDYIGEQFEGIISGVTSWGIYVELPNTVEGMVRLADMGDDRYDFQEEKCRVLGHYTGREFRMGQRVTVETTGVDIRTRTIDFRMVLEDEE